MNICLRELQKGFRQNTLLINEFAAELTSKEIFFRPYDKVNHFLWILGHITFVRNTIIKLLDSHPSLELLERERDFFMPNNSLMPNDFYPPHELILEHFNKRGVRIEELLEIANTEHLQKESWLKIGDEISTNQELLFHFYRHEIEHFGEMKMLRTIAIRARKPKRSKVILDLHEN